MAMLNNQMVPPKILDSTSEDERFNHKKYGISPANVVL